MNDSKTQRTISLAQILKSNDIIVALVVGVCLVLKVWVIRQWFRYEIDLLDLFVPPLLLAAYGPVRAIILNKKTPSRIRWDSPLLWSAVIVLATAVSIYMYVVRIRMVWNT